MEELIAKQTLEIAELKFQLLKAQSNNTQISTSTTLELASQIRDCISKNEELTEFINANEEYAPRRKNLLDEIRELQLDIIAKYAKPEKKLGNFDGNVIDFKKAKQDLVAMIETEQSLKMFLGTEYPEPIKTRCEVHERTLSKTANDCINGRFKLLIMGDFQSGKSTTVDALCDGRYVCAIGEGLATSAVLICVTYADEEYTKIHWRTKKQLTTIFDKIKQWLPDYDFKTFDLDKPKARKKLAAAINTLRTSEECPNVSDGDTKFLMLCDFILKYYGTDELSKKMVAIEASNETAEITRFPPKDETLWKKQGTTGFTIDEALFVFIEKVDCFVNSETLRKLNCIIIDSPGLFNSSYDTMVTEQAMVDANVIMYVLPYYKGMDENACKSLYAIKRNYPDVHRKLFIVNNMKPGNQKVFKSNCEKIKEMFGKEKDVYRYDARLAYLLQIKKLFDSGRATGKDYRHLLTVTVERYDDNEVRNFTEFPEAWAVQIGKYGDALGGNYVDIEAGLKISGFIAIVDALQNFINSNEAYLVIISNGLAHMTQEILEIKGSLYHSYIEPYILDQEIVENLWNNRINKARVFQDFILKSLNEAIYDGGEDSLFSRLVQEEYENMFTEDYYADLSCEVAGVIYDNKKKLLSIKSLFKKDEYKNKLTEVLTPLITEKVNDLVERKIRYSNSLIESGQDRIVRNTFVSAMDTVEEKLMQRWLSLYDDDKNFKMKDFFSLYKGLKSSVKIISGSIDGNADDLSVDRSLLLGGLAGEIASLVAGLAAMVAGYIALVFADPTGVTEGIAICIAGILLFVAGPIGSMFAGDWVRDKCVKKLGGMLLPKIKTDKTIRGFESVVERQLTLMITEYIKNQNVNIQMMENERDVAMHPTADREIRCFRSIETYKQLDEQLRIYEKYKQEHLTDETA